MIAEIMNTTPTKSLSFDTVLSYSLKFLESGDNSDIAGKLMEQKSDDVFTLDDCWKTYDAEEASCCEEVALEEPAVNTEMPSNKMCDWPYLVDSPMADFSSRLNVLRATADFDIIAVQHHAKSLERQMSDGSGVNQSAEKKACEKKKRLLCNIM